MVERLGLGIRFGMAKATARALHWGLTHVARRPGANLPGKMAMRIDPHVIADARGVLRQGSVVVAGTNGKTTCTNLLADSLEQAGFSVCCNRTGANLSYGVASALLECRGADWGVLESDELWLGRTLPALQPTYLVLLNLFRDQLDRFGEIDHIQDVIVEALSKSPRTVLIYNADDPLCAMVARRAAEVPERAGVPSVAFGLIEALQLEQNAVSDTTMCQVCNGMLEYEYRQYGQLGAYTCPECGFSRPPLDFTASNVHFDTRGLEFQVDGQMNVREDVSRETSSAETHVDANGNSCVAKQTEIASEPVSFTLQSHLAGSYMVYNLLAVATAALCVGCAPADVQRAISAFDPKNGRLQEYQIGRHRTLLNLAKNPTGFNQNLRIVVQQATADSSAECAIAFFINDNNVDGHDISWIWDIDFEELRRLPHARVFAGGIRRNDLQVRLKYADVNAELIDNMSDVFAAGRAGAFPADADVYAIANYTALAPVREELTALQAKNSPKGEPSESTDSHIKTNADENVSRETLLCKPTESSPVNKAEPATDSNASETKSTDCSQSNEIARENVSRETFSASEGERASHVSEESDAHSSESAQAMQAGRGPIVIAHMFPDLLNLYGDGGNVRILEQRLRWRDIPVEVRRVEHGETVNLDDVDLVFLGGGPDREQTLAAEQLMAMREQLADYVRKGGPILAICGGYQILGNTWLSSEGEVPGLGILDIETRRAGDSTDRLIDNIALDSPVAEHPVVGYENHASRTYLGPDVQPFGRVVSHTGHGNDSESHADGAIVDNVLGTYLHGTLLAKNPEVADWLLMHALAYHAMRTGAPIPTLPPLNDSVELTANEFMAQKLIKGYE